MRFEILSKRDSILGERGDCNTTSVWRLVPSSQSSLRLVYRWPTSRWGFLRKHVSIIGLEEVLRRESICPESSSPQFSRESDILVANLLQQSRYLGWRGRCCPSVGRHHNGEVAGSGNPSNPVKSITKEHVSPPRPIGYPETLCGRLSPPKGLHPPMGFPRLLLSPSS